jgi:hypothetical protein
MQRVLWFTAPTGEQFPTALMFNIAAQAYVPPYCAETRRQAVERLYANTQQPLTPRYLTVEDMEILFVLFADF